MAKDKLPAIPYGTTPNILLLGNGINQCDASFFSVDWGTFIEKLSVGVLKDQVKEKVNQMPYPLRPVVVTQDHVDEQIEQAASLFLPSDLPQAQREMVLRFAELDFDAILTTNYSYEIEKAIDPAFYCKMKTCSKYRCTTSENVRQKDQFGIYKYMKVTDRERGRDHRIWHIHGEAARPDSMVLGHYYYGKLLSKIQQYVSSVIGRYKSCEKRKADFQPKSWIDYFLIGNVFVVGQGLDLSEMDLWWLINCKKRNAEALGKVYFFEPKIEEEAKAAKKLLAQAYGVQLRPETFSGDYKTFYESLPECIKEIRISQKESLAP